VLTRQEECLKKVDSLRTLLNESGQESQKGILVREQPNFSWITAGGRGFLGLAATRSCAWVLVTKENAYLLANLIEGNRVMSEELPEGVFTLKTLPWKEDGKLLSMAEDLAGGAVICDDGLNDWFLSARVKLTTTEKNRFNQLSAETADALERVLTASEPGSSEYKTAGALSAALWERGIEPISLFVGADERSEYVRHFIPTSKTANERIIASVCARRGGLITSATRTVYFVTPSDAQIQSHKKLLDIEAKTFRALEIGGALGGVFNKICSAYSENGMDGEWDRHHQGGLTGYMPREIRIDGNTSRTVGTDEAYAFNLSCPGAKAEDTVLMEDGQVKIMTRCGSWPVLTVDGRERPDIFIKK
jgi:hypothetical protein